MTMMTTMMAMMGMMLVMLMAMVTMWILAIMIKADDEEMMLLGLDDVCGRGSPHAS